MADVDELKMEFLMKLQTQDFVGAEAIQKQLLKLNPGDKLITSFSSLLPAESAAQKEAQQADEYVDEYYDEEEDKEEEAKEEEEEQQEQEEEEEQKQEEVKQETEKKEGDEGEDEYDEDAYGEEDYDEEGKYIWGKEGQEWDFYYKEDKDAHERGDPVHPAVINQAPIRDLNGEESISTSASSTAGGVYKTKKRAKDWKPV